jgi:hypothetical protein
MDDLLSNLSHLMNHRKQVNEEAFSELMAKILSPWPEAAWELGPDLVDPDIDRLSLSVRDVPELRTNSSLAAQLPSTGQGWIIDFGLPPRDWEIYFEATINGEDLEIEGSEWSWSMADAGGQVTLKIVPADQFRKLGDQESNDLAGIIVTGELGESNVSKFVKSVDVSRTEQASEQWFPMESLRKKFVEKFPDCEYGAWLVSSR